MESVGVGGWGEVGRWRGVWWHPCNDGAKRWRLYRFLRMLIPVCNCAGKECLVSVLVQQQERWYCRLCLFLKSVWQQKCWYVSVVSAVAETVVKAVVISVVGVVGCDCFCSRCSSRNIGTAGCFRFCIWCDNRNIGTADCGCFCSRCGSRNIGAAGCGHFYSWCGSRNIGTAGCGYFYSWCGSRNIGTAGCGSFCWQCCSRNIGIVGCGCFCVWCSSRNIALKDVVVSVVSAAAETLIPQAVVVFLSLPFLWSLISGLSTRHMIVQWIICRAWQARWFSIVYGQPFQLAEHASTHNKYLCLFWVLRRKQAALLWASLTLETCLLQWKSHNVQFVSSMTGCTMAM